MRTPTFLRDAYRRSLRTEVVACRAQGDGFIAITPDTIVFPGGGGQPHDLGTLAGQPVLSVRADADGGWVHELPGAVPRGSAQLELDWDRRYDHMQQHSAQHLITALANDQLGLATMAFHLGAERSSIDLDASNIEASVLGELEAMVQAEIRAALPLQIRWVQPEELDGLGVRSRGLPADHRGKVRLVSIEGVDRNTCGGTHVAGTAELQLVVFVGTERVHGGITRLHFVAGQRAVDLLRSGLIRERALTLSLRCAPPEHSAAVDRVLAEQSEQARELRRLRAELAELLAAACLVGASGGLAHLHRDADDLPLLQAVASGAMALQPDALVLLTSGAPAGSFLLAGPTPLVATLGPELLPLIAGRGGGARGRFQGRAQRQDLRDQALARLRELLAAQP